MPQPMRLPAPLQRGTASVQQFVGGMYAQMDERNVMRDRSASADVLQQVEAEIFAQVVVVPVVAERKRHMEDAFLLQHFRAFHQIEAEVVAFSFEDAFHTGEVGKEEFSEAG